MKSKMKLLKKKAPEQPHGNAAEFEALLRTSMDDLMQKTRIHQESWGFGEEDQWFLNQDSGDLVFTFPDGVASGPGQVIGTFDPQAGTWTWAWADRLLPDHLKRDAFRVRDFGVEHNLQHLLAPTWPAQESHAWYMTAFACWLCHAQGAFRGEAEDTCTFLTFGEITNIAADQPGEVVLDDFTAQAVEDFKANLENPDEQRLACCRYLRRGTMVGMQQDELIHRLGLASPSILDLAGYTADLAENVMGMLKTISDDEIVEYPD